MAEQLLWFIFFAPLASFLAIVAVLRPLRQYRLAAWSAILAIGAAFAASLLVFPSVAAAPGHELSLPEYPWLEIGRFHFAVGLAADALTAVMLIVVTSVSLLVQIYSMGYMAEEDKRGYSRYYAYMSLFTASMLGLVLAGNLLQIFIFWELVGLCSYLLIGFWFHRPSAAAAAKKAFIVTRLGDVGFLLALLLVYSVAGTFEIHELFSQRSVAALAGTAMLGTNALTWVCLGIFAGAAGKSAQFPLHTWLPDAMEGPTPVSALIHAATMVAAGVYLVGRMLPLFVQSPDAMATVAVIGAFTAIFAASMGLVMNDIKRVMAYSTVSQLGYMMLALGVGGFAAAFFHLMNHAFFKALLFLGSGSVNHATGTFDMRYMGGLRKVMPITFYTVVIASLSLAGIFPLSGFWSKDEILGATLAKSPVLFGLALITVFMTAFYVFRMLFLTFGGEYRGGAVAEAAVTGIAPAAHAPAAHDAHSAPVASALDIHAAHHPHESPAVMTWPLIMLAAPSILSGLVNVPGVNAFTDFMTTHTVHEALGEHHAAFDPVLAAVSTLVAIAGIWLAWQVYGKGAIAPQTLGALLGGFPYRVLSNKYYLDYLYEQIIVRLVLYHGICGALALFDKYVVDAVVDGAGRGTRAVGAGLRQLESGQVQAYGLAIFLGVVIISATMMLRG